MRPRIKTTTSQHIRASPISRPASTSAETEGFVGQAHLPHRRGAAARRAGLDQRPARTGHQASGRGGDAPALPVRPERPGRGQQPGLSRRAAHRVQKPPAGGRAPSQAGEIFSGVAYSHAAFVLGEADIERPMHVVLDTQMSAQIAMIKISPSKCWRPCSPRGSGKSAKCCKIVGAILGLRAIGCTSAPEALHHIVIKTKTPYRSSDCLVFCLKHLDFLRQIRYESRSECRWCSPA